MTIEETHVAAGWPTMNNVATQLRLDGADCVYRSEHRPESGLFDQAKNPLTPHYPTRFWRHVDRVEPLFLRTGHIGSAWLAAWRGAALVVSQ